MTSPANDPGERPRRLDAPPSDRYRPSTVAAGSLPTREPTSAITAPLALIVGAAVAFVVLGGLLTVTSGLVVLSAFVGWLTGRLVSPPGRAAAVGVTAVLIGLLGVWLFGRMEGGVLDPIAYLLEVDGPVVVVLSLVAGGGLAGAASR